MRTDEVRCFLLQQLDGVTGVMNTAVNIVRAIPVFCVSHAFFETQCRTFNELIS